MIKLSNIIENINIKKRITTVQELIILFFNNINNNKNSSIYNEDFDNFNFNLFK